MNLYSTNKSMLNTRKGKGSTETACCMTDGDPWPVFDFGFMFQVTFLFVCCICTYYSGSVRMSIVTFFIFRLIFMVEFWFTSLLVVFLLRIVYMATTSYNLCTRQR